MLRQSLFTGICAIALLAGCESNSATEPGGIPRTEGERTLAQGRILEKQGRMITQGERLIADGKAARARGEELRSQGKTVDGERMIGEGDAKIREGEALIRQARAMPTEPLTMEGGTTQPSMNRTDRMDHDHTDRTNDRTDR